MQVISPLRFLLLTPLVLTRFSPLELDVFYLIASTTILFSIFSNRLSNVFVRMLSFAFGGATDLGKWTGKKAQTTTGQPNWELFKEAYLSLGVLLFIACLPSLILSVVLMWLSVGALVDFSFEDKRLWAGAMLGAIGPVFSFLMLRPSMALKATGNISLQNRIAVMAGIASVVLSSLAVILGGRLIAILLVQLAITTFSRWLMGRYLPREIRPFTSHIGWSYRIFNWAREPLWKGLVTVLAGMGVQRGVGVFLAFTGTVGLAGPFLFVQSLLSTCQTMASAPLNSQIPRYSKMLEEGKRAQIGADSLVRIFATSLLFSIAVIVISFAIPVLLPLIGSNMTALPVKDSLLLGGLRCLYWPLICFNLVQGVSNDVKVVWRFLVASPFSLALFYIGSQTQEYVWFSLGMYVPFILALNWYTLRNYLEFVGKRWSGVSKEAREMAWKRLQGLVSKLFVSGS